MARAFNSIDLTFGIPDDADPGRRQQIATIERTRAPCIPPPPSPMHAASGADLERPAILRKRELAAAADQLARYADDNTSAVRALTAAGFDAGTAVEATRIVLADLARRNRLG